MKHKDQALRVLRNVEKDNGETSKETAKKCREYAIEELGSEKYTPWLLVYSNVSGGFKEGWIPDNFYSVRVVPWINGWYGKTSARKPLNGAILGRGDEIPDRAYYVNGLFLDQDYRVLRREDLRDHVFADSARAVYKIVSYGQGDGLYFFDRDTFDPGSIPHIGDGVFQPWIAQHPELDQFGGGTVATLRLTTAVDGAGDISCRSAYLRLGRSRDTHVRSSTHIRVAVDPTSGVLDETGYLENWRQTREHPDTHAAFKGFEVPGYERCLEAAKRFHARVPYVRCIGWDLAVDRDGEPKIMEWNGGHNDIKFSEATQGPCFRGLGWESIDPKVASGSLARRSDVREARSA